LLGILKYTENAQEFELFLAKYGWYATGSNFDMNNVRTLLNVESGLIDALEIANQIQNEFVDEEERLDALFNTLKELMEIIRDFTLISTTGLPYPLNQTAFWEQLKADLLPDLLVQYLEKEKPAVYAVLHLFQVIEYEQVDPADPDRITYVRTVIHWDRLGRIIFEPGTLITESYGWGQTQGDFDYLKFLAVLERCFNAMGFKTFQLPPRSSLTADYLDSSLIEDQQISELDVEFLQGITQPDRSYWKVGASILPIPETPNASDLPNALVLSLFSDLNTEINIPLGAGVSIQVTGALFSDDTLRLELLPAGAHLTTSGQETYVAGELAIVGNPETPYIIIGGKDTTRLELEGFKAAFGIRGAASDIESYVTLSTGDPGNGGQLPKLNLVLAMDENDGFLGQLLGKEPLKVGLGAELTWSSKTGVLFNGQYAAEVTFAERINIGPVSINGLKGKVQYSNDVTKIGIGFGTTLNLGPVTLTVEGIGVQWLLTPKDGPSDPGIFGSLDVEFEATPPSGIGVEIKTTAVTGSGYLYLKDGEYIGAVELSIKDLIRVSAIGVITTKMPDGGDGYSFLVIASADNLDIQLGMGFTLEGLGGLLGYQRTIKTDVIRYGLQNGIMDSILFPRNVVSNIQRIVSDIKNIFPVQREQFVIAPMGKLGWGTPTLIDLEVGLALEMSKPTLFGILGKLSVLLPDENAKILQLNVAFIGVIDFSRQKLFFDASIYNSRLLAFNLSGDMAVRLFWGSQKEFVFTVGGFHPAYKPASDLQLPKIRRMTLSLLSDNPRLTLTNYFAVTSNTVQFGAAIDFYFHVSKVNVRGGLSFDVLFQFNPFYLNAQIKAMLGVFWGDSEILGLSLDFMLEGPTPWHAKGSASFKVLFIRVKVRFDKTFGENRTTLLTDVEVTPLLKEAFEEKGNWSAALPANRNLLVSHRGVEASASELVLHPLGTLTVTQNVVPLDVDISLFGNQRPSGANHFHINSLSIGSANLDIDPVKSDFAPAQFFTMGKDDKLKARSFEKYTSGIKARGGEELEANHVLSREVDYELVVIDGPEVSDPLAASVYDAGFAAEQFFKGGAVSRTDLSRKAVHSREALPNKISLGASRFGVVTKSGMDLVAPALSDSRYEALAMLEQLQQDYPEWRDQLTVVPEFELNF